MHDVGGQEPPRAAVWFAGVVVRWRWAIAALAIVGTAFAARYAATLPVYTDFSYLLPPSARSVKDLRAIEKRARVIGTAMVAVESKDPVAREKAARMLRDGILALGPSLISSLTFDQGAARKFGWDNRWLFASLEDLEKARDSLRKEIDRAKLEANPLYVDLDDAPAPTGPDAAAELRKKLADAEAKKDDPGELVSDDKTLQMMVIRTAFSSADSAKDIALLEGLEGVIADVKQQVPGTDIGVAGDVVVTLAEHDAILNGMLIATLVTIGLVGLALLLFYRSILTVGALSWSLMVGTIATFALTRGTIGHLNLATAFLSSIVIGNGINCGIIVAARYIEELRAGRRGADAVARTFAGTFKGTLAASLTAATAYASLVITDFRGFRHFGVIGGMGMILCWISAYTVLPACLAIVERAGKLRPREEPAIGRTLERLVPKRLGRAAFVILWLAAAAGGVTAWFLTHHPFESNFRNLRTYNGTITEEERWMGKVDHSFGQGISGGFVIAVPTRAEVRPLVERLRALDAGKDDKHKLFSRLNTLDDLLPADQDKKLAVLAEIRGMLTPDALDAMSDDDRRDALKLRPPDDLRALGDDDVPEELAWPFIEADQSRGKVILAMSGWGYEIWNADDLVRFSDDVRRLDLDGALLGGTAFVFADVLRSIERDGPRATMVACIAAILVVIVIMGWSRHAFATLVCGAVGTVFMLAAAALLDMHINFLDFVALPITVGIGIDYAVNIAARDRADGPGHAREVLHTVGGAVALSSYTTIVGYGTLLLSQNRAIRSFGGAAILGELTCLTTALVLAPALLWVLAERARKRRAK
ncbi:MAG TPA: MMPL family transporter [Kofleriaceae bacterium]|nr:MMPL family transporter [Kofleriaceae bacterium]